MENKKNAIDYREIGQERVITIADLIKEIIRRFWLVIVLAVIFAALAGGYKYMKDSKAAATQTGAESPVASNLTEEDQKEVDNILLIEDNMLQQQEYAENSVLMKIDPYNESVATLQYYFNAESAADSTAQSRNRNLLDLYESYVNNGTLTDDLTEKGADLDAQYLGELISCESQAGMAADSASDLVVLEQQATSFSIKIIHADDDSCRKLAEKVAECIQEYQDKLISSVGQHELVLVDTAYARMVDNTLLTYKYDRVNSIVTMQERIETLKENLSAEQLEAVEAQAGQLQAVADGEEVSESDTAVSVTISKKYVAVGALGGIILACLFIVICYVMRGTINKAEDLQYLYNIRILGEMNMKDRKNVFLSLWNKLIGRREKVLTLDEQIALLKTNLRLACEKEQIHKLLISGCDGKTLEYLQDAFGNLEEDGLHLEYVQDLFDSPQSLGKLAEFNDVVFVEFIRKSQYSDIIKQIKICSEQQVTVLGAVVVSA